MKEKVFRSIAAIIIVGVLLFLTSFISTLLGFPLGNIFTPKQHIIPDQVQLSLDSQVESNVRYGVLSFRTPAGGGCDDVGDLQLKNTLQNGRVQIEVLGYDFRQSSGAGVCPTVLTDSTGEILIHPDQLKENEPVLVTISLNGQNNEFTLINSNYKLTLSSVTESNIISSPIYPQSEDEDQVVGYYPLDVLRVYLSGRVQDGINYQNDMLEVIKRYGLEPASNKYPGIDGVDINGILVVPTSSTTQELPYNENRAYKLGNLPTYPDVEVNITNTK